MPDDDPRPDQHVVPIAATDTTSGATAALVRWVLPPEEPDDVRKARRPLAAAVAAGLAAAGALHVVWATGSPWPAPDAKTLARTALGDSDRTEMPGAGGCLVIAGALGTAAAAALARVSGSPRARLLGQVGTRGAGAVLGARGVVGLVLSSTGLGGFTRKFRVRDLTAYSPLCLALAAGLLRLGDGAPPERDASSGTA